MANEIQFAHTATGDVLYAIIRNRFGQPYNFGGMAFEDYVTANIDNYGIGLSEQGSASRFYVNDFPAMAADRYCVTFFKRLGGAIAEGDTLLGQFYFEWAGSVPYSLNVLFAQDTAIKARTDNLPSIPASQGDVAVVLTKLPAALVGGRIDASVGDVPSAQQQALADAILDRAAGVETGYTVRQAMRLLLASIAGKLSGGGTATITVRNPGDTKNRIIATVTTDGTNNRTAMTFDVT